MQDSVTNFVCNDGFAFCGLENVNVKVYNLDGGDLVAELAPSSSPEGLRSGYESVADDPES